MSVDNKCMILTGAAGGIGRHLAQQLDAAGARLMLVDMSSEGLEQTLKQLDSQRHITLAADLTDPSSRKEIVDKAHGQFGHIDTLINCAGINPFGVYAEQESDMIQKTLEINLLAPMLLTHDVLPHMQKQNSGHIVNIGSTFGSIGFAWFTAYSASKFGLRGFSQALRRELDGSGIDVSYIAPRAVKTAINSGAVYEMAKEVKMTFDDPGQVAQQILRAIEKRQREIYIGFPESFFVKVNAIAPGIVDNALKKQNQAAHIYASRESMPI